MDSTNDARCSGYWGDVKTGKTTLAIQHAFADAQVRGLPIVIVDGFTARNFDAWRKDCLIPCNRLIDVVIEKGRNAVIQPRNEQEMEAVCAAVRAGGLHMCRCVMLIDEVAPWASARSNPQELTLLIRSHRHCGIPIYMTSQYLGDVSPTFLQCTEAHYFFKNTSPRAVERIRQSFPSLDIERIQSLQLGEFITNAEGVHIPTAQ
jgi:hypothetical protein